jgi:hypothetical protein
MHEVGELIRVATPMATVGGAAVIAQFIKTREARRSRRMAGGLVPVEAELLAGGSSKDMRSASSVSEASQESR